jgi:hypothetical protein
MGSGGGRRVDSVGVAMGAHHAVSAGSGPSHVVPARAGAGYSSGSSTKISNVRVGSNTIWLW